MGHSRVVQRPYLIHIGYHKTGTTWLQRHYFSRRHAGFAFSRECGRTVTGGIEGMTPGRFITDQPLFHYDPKATRAAFDRYFAADIAVGLTPVISYEELSGNASSGGWRSKEFAWRLAETFPEARILIVVREQRTMIRACYMQYLRAGGAVTLRDFMMQSSDPNVPQPDLYYYRYNGLVELYRKLFSPEQVLCVPFEWFRQRPREYLDRLDAFSGAAPDLALPVEVVENPGRDMLQYPLARLLNPLMRRNSANGRSPYAIPFLNVWGPNALRIMGRMAPAAWDRALVKRWERTIESCTAGFYEESNRCLGELIGFDLRQFGWRVAADALPSEPRSPTRRIAA